MPQKIHVVQCFKCHKYQSDIVKKVNKWSCKMCGEKQSLKHVYGIGTGKECRLIVQKLSEKNMQADLMTSNVVESILDGMIKNQELPNENIKMEPAGNFVNATAIWGDLLDNHTEKEEDTLPQTSLSVVTSNFYTKPERKSSSSSYSVKFHPYMKPIGTKILPKLVGYHNKEGSQSREKSPPRKLDEEESSIKEFTATSLKVKHPETHTNNDYWGTDNLNDEELDEILKLDF